MSESLNLSLGSYISPCLRLYSTWPPLTIMQALLTLVVLAFHKCHIDLATCGDLCPLVYSLKEEMLIFMRIKREM